LQHFFATGPSFLDPQISKDGKPYGPKRFKEIVKECWYISDNLHTSYTDILDLSVAERLYLVECIGDKAAATKKAMDEFRNKNKN
jgi:hypothetical protein